MTSKHVRRRDKVTRFYLNWECGWVGGWMGTLLLNGIISQKVNLIDYVLLCDLSWQFGPSSILPSIYDSLRYSPMALEHAMAAGALRLDIEDWRRCLEACAHVV